MNAFLIGSEKAISDRYYFQDFLYQKLILECHLIYFEVKTLDALKLLNYSAHLTEHIHSFKNNFMADYYLNYTLYNELIIQYLLLSIFCKNIFA